jgi:hypothetical protein
MIKDHCINELGKCEICGMHEDDCDEHDCLK